MSCQCFSVLSFFHFLVKAQRAKLKVSDTTAFLYNVETLRHIVEITFNLLRTSQGLNVELNELRNTSEASNSSFTCLAVCAPRCSQSTVWHVVRYAKMYIHKYALHLKSHFWIHNGGKRYIKALQAWTIIHNNTPTSLRVFMTRCCDRVNQKRALFIHQLFFVVFHRGWAGQFVSSFEDCHVIAVSLFLVFYLHISINISLDLMLRNYVQKHWKYKYLHVCAKSSLVS